MGVRGWGSRKGLWVGDRTGGQAGRQAGMCAKEQTGLLMGRLVNNIRAMWLWRIDAGYQKWACRRSAWLNIKLWGGGFAPLSFT